MMDVRSGEVKLPALPHAANVRKVYFLPTDFLFLLRRPRKTTLMIGRSETFRRAAVTLLCRRGATDSVNKLWTDLLTVRITNIHGALDPT